IIHHSRDSIDSIIDVCARAQNLSEKPIEVGDELVHVSPRVGIALYPDDSTSAAGLLDCAVSALSEARTSQPMFYSPEVQRHALKFIRTEARLHEALDRKQLELWYQPQINLLTGDVIGVEALVRWRLPNGELVPPMEFIPVAEAVGLVRDIDRWVLQEACRVMQQWNTNRIGIPRVAVNVSAEDINAPDFATHVQAMLARHELPPPSLELEITESTLFEISDENMSKLNSLRQSGISIAVDDFGTGYSSLSYLHRLPITTLKIDKSFVDKVDTDKTHEAVASTIVWLAGNFGLETVAEGIETEQQAEKLRSMNVTTGQGYLYARPMPEKELLRWLSNHVRAASSAVRK
ncbi:MAG: GGDEF domain-containing phosphodiesterase, partial [Proteobacteria bacterium]|nr:GGDEF domain-containing phosphodiesterase [Pseudomonadota bacterium]